MGFHDFTSGKYLFLCFLLQVCSDKGITEVECSEMPRKQTLHSDQTGHQQRLVGPHSVNPELTGALLLLFLDVNAVGLVSRDTVMCTCVSGSIV